MNRDRLISQLRGLRPELESRGVEHLAIYGSRARGDARPDSDLDLLIDVKPDARFSLLDLVGVEHMVSDATGFEAMGAMRRSIPDRLRQRIDDDIVEVF